MADGSRSEGGFGGMVMALVVVMVMRMVEGEVVWEVVVMVVLGDGEEDGGG